MSAPSKNTSKKNKTPQFGQLSVVNAKKSKVEATPVKSHGDGGPAKAKARAKVSETKEDAYDEEEDEEDDEFSDHESYMNFGTNNPAKSAFGDEGNISDEEDGETKTGDIIDVAFEFFDPSPEKDYHATRAFLTTYLDDTEFNASEMSDLICGQVAVGTMIKVDDAGSEPLGFITAVNMQQHQNLECIQQIKKFLLKYCGNDKNKQILTNLFNSKKPLGLFLQNRVVNLPLELIPPLHDALHRDLEFAQNESEPKDERPLYAMENFVMLTRCCNPNTNGKGKNNTEEAWWLRFEEEFYRDEASLVHTFPAKKETPWPEVGKLPQMFVLMTFPRSALPKIVMKMNAVLSEGAL